MTGRERAGFEGRFESADSRAADSKPERERACGERLLWPEQGYYQEHLCALPAGHAGRHSDQDGRWWPDQGREHEHRYEGRGRDDITVWDCSCGDTMGAALERSRGREQATVVLMVCGHWKRPDETVGTRYAFCVRCGRYQDVSGTASYGGSDE